jgi:lipopolysaccharide export system permease protein
LMVFIVYLNMLSAAKAWIEQGSISPMLGLWWVHGVMLAIALGLLGVQNSVHKRLLS